MCQKIPKQPVYIYVVRPSQALCKFSNLYHNLYTYLCAAAQCLEFSKSYVGSLKFNTCLSSVPIKTTAMTLIWIKAKISNLEHI